MNKYFSRKLVVTLVALASALTTAYSSIPTEVQTKLYDFLATVMTFYLVAQGSVDTVGKFKEPKVE